MEATGVLWEPVWNILSDGDFELIVANAAHIKNVPGRKTDVNDATWIADLLACGLIRGSFVPSEKFQELRALQRTRKQLTREQTRHIQRLQKTLEESNIKLDSVISDIMGVSGRRMIEAIIAGVRTPRKLADLADGRIKATPKELCDALHGRVTDHHRFRGAPKAFCAVAASLLTAIYHMLKDGTKFRDLGEDHFDKRPMKAKVNRLLAQLAKLGYQADLRPFANAA